MRTRISITALSHFDLHIDREDGSVRFCGQTLAEKKEVNEISTEEETIP
jgi:hypothetical protein